MKPTRRSVRAAVVVAALAALSVGGARPAMAQAPAPTPTPTLAATRRSRAHRPAWPGSTRPSTGCSSTGAVRHPGRRMEGPAVPGIGEWIMNRARSRCRLPAARGAVQPGQVQRRRLGPARQGRGHEVHGHHLEAPRRLRALRLEGRAYDVVDATPFKRDILKELSAACAKGHAPRVLLFAIAGLARAERRRQRLGLRPATTSEGLRRVPAREGRAAGPRAADRLRPGGARLVRHAAHDDRRPRAALHRHRARSSSRTR